MKNINWKIRLTSFKTWVLLFIPVVSIIWNAGGFQASDLDSWTTLKLSFMTFVHSPAALVAVVSAFIATYVDPTTQGLSDSAQARLYEKPRKDEEK